MSSTIFPLKPEDPAFPVEGDGSLNEVFRRILVQSFPAPPSGKVVTIKSDTSIAEACRILSENNILSAPVLDVTQPSDASWSSKYSGVVDFMAIVDWMMDKTWGHSPADLKELLSLRVAFNDTPVSVLSEHARWTQFIPVDNVDNTLLDVMLILGKYGAHRVWAVNSPGGDIRTVITQSGVVDQLGNNMDSLSALTSKPLSSLGVIREGAPASVSTKDSFWDAFRVMSNQVVSAVPILNDAGAVVGTLSAHDLRFMILEPAKFRAMTRPIGEYADLHRDLFICRRSDSLEHVIRAFQGSHVHRLWVVDGDNKPVGVVSLREVLAAFVREPDGDTLRQYFTR